MRGAWIALLLMIANGSLAEPPKNSGPPAKGPPVKANFSNQTRDSQYPTKDAPFPVTVVQSSDDAQRAAAREKSTDKYQDTYLDTQIRLVKVACATAGIAGCEILIGIIALYYLRKTFRETHRTANAAETSIKVSQRAYVHLKDLTTEPFRDARKVRFTPIFTNSGSTPAKRSITHTSLEVRSDALPLNFNFEDRWPLGEDRRYDQLFIGAGAQSERRGRFVDIDLFDLDSTKKNRFYAWGWIDYDDVLNGTPRHRTEFAFELIMKPTFPFGTDNFSLEVRQWLRFNGTDDECDRKPRPYEETLKESS